MKPFGENDRSVWSQWMFSYVQPLLDKANKGKQIKEDDLFPIEQKYKTQRLCSRLESEWEKELQNRQNGKGVSFTLAVVRAFWKYYTFTGIFYFIEEFSRLMQPILFSWIVEYLTGRSRTCVNEVWYYTLCLCILASAQALLGPVVLHRHHSAATRWKVATTALIYKKVLKLPKSKLNEISTGHIIGLLNQDASKYHDVIWQIHATWIAPVKIAVTFWFMYNQLGTAVLVGYLTILVLASCVTFTSARVSQIAKHKVESVNKRVQLMSEIISGIRIIKMYCWEKPFGKQLAHLRKLELKYLWRCKIYRPVIDELFVFNSRLVLVSMVITAVVFGYELEASSVFPLFALFNIINEAIMCLCGHAFRTFSEFNISMKRIQDFLLNDEIRDKGKIWLSPPNSQLSMYISGLSAEWSNTSLALNNMTIKVFTGELVAVVGKVGAGKSSLLNAIIGELEFTEGTLHVDGTLGYAAQQPWLFPDTIRNNVLCGREHNPLVFKQVMDVTALSEDLAMLPRGEMTHIGDQGLMLSGGQKARVNLARVLYQDPDVFLFDDPLSPVDSRVGRHIFEKCIKGYLKTKTRILVTHQLQYLKEVDKVIIMDEGQIVFQGRYEDIHNTDIDLKTLLPEQKGEENVIDRVAGEDTIKNNILTDASKHETREDKDKDPRLGSWEILKGYCKCRLYMWDLVAVVCLNILCQVALNGADWWLAMWTKKKTRDSSSTSDVTVFLLLTASVFTVCVVRTLVFFRYGLRLSRLHHENMYKAVIRSPTRFFDTNPSGRILTRFTTDLRSIDEDVPTQSYTIVTNFLLMIGSLVYVVCLQPVLVVPAVWMVILLMKYWMVVQRAHAAGCAELESNARSPVLTHIKSTIEGVDTVRALDKQQWCVAQFEELADTLHGRFWTNLSIASWFKLRMNLVVLAFYICTVVSFVFAKDYIDPAVTAVTITYLLPMIKTVRYVGQTSYRLLLELTKVGRILDYSRLPPEAPLTGPNVDPSWPAKGDLTFDNVSLKYCDEGPIILKDLNIRVQAGERIGIVGRTGAGKSSLIRALFRMTEPEGEIYIDGMALSSLGLHDVRWNISIIPQDPVMFSGSIRSNLDPFEEHSDDQLWMALGDVQMNDIVEQLPESLASPMTEGGSTFSVGQKQLLCLARSLLRQNKILLMDEATASVDKRTDQLIQETIKRVFKNCTVLTVAHRLDTIMDCDRIMVMHEGRLVEFDEPHILLQNPEGRLSAFANDTGQAERRKLRDMARKTYIKKRTH